MATSTMSVTKAEKNVVAGVRTFFVRSESDEKLQYIVVEIRRNSSTVYHCNCHDFMFRKLPFLGTNLYSNCKHGQAVVDAIGGKS